jgi:MFS family permease
MYISPMMVWSAAPFIGPTLGPLVSGFINQNMNWRWAYYVIIIWAAIMMALLLLFVPETYSPELLRRRASR